MPARAASGCRLLAALALIATVVAGMFVSMVVTTRSLDAISKAGRKSSEMTQSALELERLVVDTELGDRSYEREPPGDREAARRSSTASVRPRCRTGVDTLALHLRQLKGPQRIAIVRTEFAALEPRAAGDHPERVAPPSQALRTRMVVLGRERRRAVGRAAGAARRSACTASCSCPSAASPAPPSGSPHGHLDTRVPATGLGEIGQLGAVVQHDGGRRWPRATRTLRVQTDRLQGILDHTTTTISVKDRDGRYLLVNEQWRQAMGQVGVDVLGRTDDELFPADIAAAIRVTDVEILRTGQAGEYERDAADRRAPVPHRQVPAQGRRRHASTRPARWAPTSASASARSPRPSRPRARSPSSWPT